MCRAAESMRRPPAQIIAKMSLINAKTAGTFDAARSELFILGKSIGVPTAGALSFPADARLLGDCLRRYTVHGWES